MSDAEALALWNALNQWVDNETSRDDDVRIPDLVILEPVIERLNVAFATMYEEDISEIMGS